MATGRQHIYCAVVCMAASLIGGVQASDVTLMTTWTDHAVLQSTSDGGAGAVVYGYATAKPSVTLSVTPSGPTIGTVTYDTTTQRWSVPIASEAGGPYALTLSGDGVASTTIQDVYFGDVFLCSGQSNMEFPLHGIDNATAEIAASNRTNLRLFSAPDNTTFPTNAPVNGPPATAFPGPVAWILSSPDTSPTFSAICYLQAVNIMRLRTADRAIGLIQTAKGGTPVEAWSTVAGLTKCGYGTALPTPFQGNNATGEYWSNQGTLFMQMIGPFIGTQLRSFLWYQGEANMNEGFHLTRANYGCLFREMIRDWRSAFGNQSIPFNLVQLHSCDGGNTGQCYDDWCNYGDIRMAHADASQALDSVAYAVSFDHGAAGIHTPHKSEVGRRLALKVLETAYGEPTGPASGPLVRGACSVTQTDTPGTSVEKLANAGNKPGTRVRVYLDNAAKLVFKNTMTCETQTPVCCNATAGGPPGVAVGLAQIQFCNVWQGGVWFDAAVTIESSSVSDDSSSASILLTALVDMDKWTNAGSGPVCQVRMNFGAFPSCAVLNSNGIPLAPFGPLAVSPSCTAPGPGLVPKSPLAFAPTAPPGMW